jgi:hypothetical protein
MNAPNARFKIVTNDRQLFHDLAFCVGRLDRVVVIERRSFLIERAMKTDDPKNQWEASLVEVPGDPKAM